MCLAMLTEFLLRNTVVSAMAAADDTTPTSASTLR
jgi:hypothetical protein